MSTHKATQEQIEADIERQRSELASTVTELQHRLDVKSRAQEKAAHLKDRATTDSGRPRPDLVLGAAVGVGAVVALLVWRARRR